MLRAFTCAALVLLGASTAQAQSFALPTQAEQHAADLASWGTVLAGVALDTRASWQATDRRHAFETQALRVGVTYAAVFAAKVFLKRDRPCSPSCGRDNPHMSFFSGHTALAFSTVGGARASISLPLASVTGVLRVAANKHWPSDVLAGAAVGLVTSRIR
jgi:hypothetical protein